MPEPKKKCPVCSELLNIDVIRCPKCGATFGERPGASGTEMTFPSPEIPAQAPPAAEPTPANATLVSIPVDETATAPRSSTDTMVSLPSEETVTAPKSSTATIVSHPEFDARQIPPAQTPPPSSTATIVSRPEFDARQIPPARTPPPSSTATIVSTPQQDQELRSHIRQAGSTAGQVRRTRTASAPSLQVDAMPAAEGKPRSVLIWSITAGAIVGLCLCVLAVAGYIKRDSIAAIFAPKPTTTQTPAPTKPPTPVAKASPTVQEPTQAIATTVNLLLWVTQSSDATTRLAREFEAQNPGTKVDVREIPADGVVNRWERDVRIQNGPDLLLFSNANLYEMVESGSVLALDGILTGQQEGVSPVALEGVKVNGHIYGVPRSFNTMALYINTSMVPVPPKTTQELIGLVEQGQRIVIIQQPYYLYGFFTAFGGALADSDGRCIADQVGFAEAMQYMLDLKQAGAIFELDHQRAIDTFRLGGAAMIVNDPWLLEDFSKTLGDDLTVVPIPANRLPGAPLSQVDAFFINPNSTIPQAALDLALFLTSASAEEAWAGEYLIPVRTDVKVFSQPVQGFMDAAQFGVPMPQAAWFSNFWSPFTKMVNEVMDGKYKPIDAVQKACLEMNQANGK